MHYILVVIIFGSYVQVTTLQEFDSKLSCENAAKKYTTSIHKHSKDDTFEVFCTEK